MMTWQVRAPSEAPHECSVLRQRWSDEDADTPLIASASRELARRVMRARAARWGSVRGRSFEPGGMLKTPWSKGTWGVLLDQPGAIFADFGHSQHELSFAAWPAFTSTRCADGDVVRGSMLEGG